jgi:uncharacterized membrane protein
MKFKLEITINKPRPEVWRMFTAHENMNKWQPSLVNIELISGAPGQAGAVSKLTYKENEREFSLIEKVTRSEELNQFDVIYENEFTDNPVKNKFIEHGENETRWIIDANYKFKTLLMKIMGPTMKKNFVRRTYRDMERFKEFVESTQKV